MLSFWKRFNRWFGFYLGNQEAPALSIRERLRRDAHKCQCFLHIYEIFQRDSRCCAARDRVRSRGSLPHDAQDLTQSFFAYLMGVGLAEKRSALPEDSSRTGGKDDLLISNSRCKALYDMSRGKVIGRTESGPNNQKGPCFSRSTLTKGFSREAGCVRVNSLDAREFAT